MSSSLTLGPTSDAPRSARRFVRARCLAWGLAGDDLELVTTELVTNAVVHARTLLAVRLERGTDATSDGRVLVTVRDLAPLPVTVPLPRHLLATAECGRGHLIVAELSVSWGVRAELPDGKAYWAAVDLAPAPEVVGGWDRLEGSAPA